MIGMNARNGGRSAGEKEVARLDRIEILDVQTRESGRPDVQTGDGEKFFRSRVERQRVTLRLPRQILKKAKVFCAINGIDLQDLAAEGIELVMARVLTNLDVQTSTFNDFDKKTIDDDEETPSSSLYPEPGRPDAQTREERILGFYATHSGNRLKEADRVAYREIAGNADNVIKCGILKSILLCTSRVNSFRYCHGAIEEIAEAGLAGDAEGYLPYLLSKIQSRMSCGKNRPGQNNLPGHGGSVTDISTR